MFKYSAIIANNLIYLRRKNGLTQLDLASKINYSDNAISRWERGEVTPTIETLEIIASYFGITIIDFLDENFPTKNEPKNTRSLLQRIFVILFSVSVVWTLALIAYIYAGIFHEQLGEYAKHSWLIFIISVPVSLLVLYYFNREWGNKVFHLIIFSLFWWSLIATFYLLLLVLNSLNLWLIFILGVPIQLAQLLWYLTRH